MISRIFFIDVHSDIIPLVILKLSNIHCISKFIFQVVLQHRSSQFSQFISKKYVWPVELLVTELGLLKKSAVLQWTNMLRNVVVSIIGSNVKFSVWLKRNSFVGKKNLRIYVLFTFLMTKSVNGERRHFPRKFDGLVIY